MFALYFQNGLGYTPLQSGLAVTPFAIGSAASAVVGGRLVERFGRLLTVTGLSLVVGGLAVTAVVLQARARRAPRAGRSRCPCCWPGSAAVG